LHAVQVSPSPPCSSPSNQPPLLAFSANRKEPPHSNTFPNHLQQTARISSLTWCNPNSHSCNYYPSSHSCHIACGRHCCAKSRTEFPHSFFHPITCCCCRSHESSLCNLNAPRYSACLQKSNAHLHNLKVLLPLQEQLRSIVLGAALRNQHSQPDWRSRIPEF
jgi:hypothetical protein